MDLCRSVEIYDTNFVEVACKRRAEQIDYDFGFLPVEIVVNILERLPFGEIKSATVACKRWREAINHPKIQSKFCLQISLSKQMSYHNLFRVFELSETKFAEVRIETCHSHLELTDVYALINSDTSIFDDVKYLILQKTKLTFHALCLLLSKTKKLNSLTVNACDIDNSTMIDLKSCQRVIENLKTLNMTTSVIGNSEKLLSMLNLTSHLVEFDVYCTSFGGYLETSTQMVKLLINIIRQNAQTLKKIYLKTFEYGEPFVSISDVSELKLESLSVVFSHHSTPYIDGFVNFISKQRSLQFLDICTLSNFRLNLLPEHLVNLEHMKIFACCDNFENFNVHTISKFANLKILEVKGHISLRPCVIEPRINRSLTELVLEMSDVAECDIIAISKAFPSLKILKLCSSNWTDAALQAIIRHVKGLRVLKLDCYRGSDFGISGYNSFTQQHEGLPIWHLTELESLRFFYTGVLNRDVVKQFFRFGKLKELFLENTGMNEKHSLTTDYLWKIIENCPALQLVRFSFYEEANAQCILELEEMLKSKLKTVKTCHFKNCISINDLI